jgi:glycerate kinase
MGDGVRRAWPDAVVAQIPLVDGPGLAATLVGATRGRWVAVDIDGPFGERRSAGVGLLGGPHAGTAVLEVADCTPIDAPTRPGQDPMLATSRGVGDLIRAALDAGSRRLIVGCGAARVLDAGLGMLQALGARALDHEGRDLGRGGTELKRLARIDLAGLDARLADTTIHAAVDPGAVLLGRRGVARLDGPAAAVEPWQVVRLERGLIELANALERATGHWIGHQPGGGACGGLGAMLAAALGAQLHPRFDVVLRYLDVERRLDECDVVFAAAATTGLPADRDGSATALTAITQRLRSRPLPFITLVLESDDADRDAPRPTGNRPEDAATAFTLRGADRIETSRLHHWITETTTASCRLLAHGQRMASWTAGPALAAAPADLPS